MNHENEATWFIVCLVAVCKDEGQGCARQMYVNGIGIHSL